jgi:hypothetical protein
MEWISWVNDPNAWVSLAVLTFLEIVLGIDNVIFISILAGKLPHGQQAEARKLGLALALVTRILLLLSIKWLMGLTRPMGAVFSHEFSCKDLILFSGGLFLIAKSTLEIHAKLEAAEKEPIVRAHGGLVGTIIQIALLDIVFSLGHNRSRNGATSAGNDCGRDGGFVRDDAGGRGDQSYCQPASDDKDARAGVSDHDWSDASSRRTRSTY